MPISQWVECVVLRLNNLMPNHADWNIRFASNQLVLCYTDNSRFADDVNAGNWTDILGRKGVVWGHSDPNLY